MIRPMVALPTGTAIPLPVLLTFMPRRSPSEEPMAIVRTMPSPSCCCTSKTRSVSHMSDSSALSSCSAS
ncbi:MAG: hypothetical protein AW07_03708 [Candidatus Accumulibacter sp. SK-11]|nr:MAG: hypothetical protein AW07_03708 [Candidatus Accumulibacter sp. SK-11]